MKTLKRTAATIAALFLFLVTAAQPAHAQPSISTQLMRMLDATTVAGSYQADDVSPAFRVRYIGTSESGSVAVDAGTGDLTFTDGTEGGEVATDTFECPVSGALGGVIDVSNAACNTVEEVMDIVNASADWRIVPVGALLNDTMVDTLLTISATAATSSRGLELMWDTSVALHHTVLLTDVDGYEISSLLAGATAERGLFKPNPYAGYRTVAEYAVGESNYGANASTFTITASTLALAANSSETRRTLFTQAAGADDTSKVWGNGTNAFPPQGIRGNPGERLLLRITDTVTMDTAKLQAYGYTYK